MKLCKNCAHYREVTDTWNVTWRICVQPKVLEQSIHVDLVTGEEYVRVNGEVSYFVFADNARSHFPCGATGEMYEPFNGSRVETEHQVLWFKWNTVNDPRMRRSHKMLLRVNEVYRGQPLC